MKNDKEIAKLADAIIQSNGDSFIIDCEIHWKSDKDNKTSTRTICYCSEDEYDKLSSDETFDDTIFYYITDRDGDFKEVFNECHDWEIIEVFENTFEYVK